jgi:integrase
MSFAVQLLDAVGRRRSPATMPDFRAGRAPGNKRQRYAADPPTIDEIIAVMRHAGHARYGNRLNGLIVVLSRAGLRINEALSLTETDLEDGAGRFWSGTARTIAAARSGWTRGGGQRSDHGCPSARRCRRPDGYSVTIGIVRSGTA